MERCFGSKPMYALDIAFVILNYNIYDETVDCVESIKAKIDTNHFCIIIVDNNSNNEIFIKLESKYKDDSKVFLLRNNSNLGFAKGNNIGIREARNKGAKYICCLNNDTLLISEDFLRTISEKYKQYNSAVIGPRIILKNGSEQHRNGRLLSIAAYKQMLSEFNAPNNKNHVLKQFLKNNRIIRTIYDRHISKYRSGRSKYYEETVDVILHGCCLIFTPVFFEKLDGFYKDTFLYMEEELLFASLMATGLHSLYCPELKIKHLEDISTNTIIKKNKEKQVFIRRHTRESLKILISFLQENSWIYDDANNAAQSK